MPDSPPLVDPFGRRIRYLRISVTPYCNLRCSYCQPDGPVMPGDGRDEMSPEEIVKIASVFARLGVEKIRLTGGEPTLRKDLVEIVAKLAALAGVRDLSLSTHGMFLAPLAGPLRRAGLQRVNVSLDTTRPERFARIAGRDAFDRVMAGLEAAREAGLSPIKLNVVPQRGVNDDEIGDLIELAGRHGAQLRLIELMPLELVQVTHEKLHLGGQELLDLIARHGEWRALERKASDGPARMYRRVEDGRELGIIDPLNPRFCENCNRVRITHDGALRNCLFGEANLPLRHLLAEADWDAALERALREAILVKPEKHRLEKLDTGRLKSLVNVGG